MLSAGDIGCLGVKDRACSGPPAAAGTEGGKSRPSLGALERKERETGNKAKNGKMEKWGVI